MKKIISISKTCQNKKDNNKKEWGSNLIKKTNEIENKKSKKVFQTKQLSIKRMGPKFERIKNRKGWNWKKIVILYIIQNKKNSN